MKKPERNLDFFISKKLEEANIDFKLQASEINEVNEALKSASKKGTGNYGSPDIIGHLTNFLLIIENKKDLDKLVKYDDNKGKIIAKDSYAVQNFAVNGALHYARHIIEHTSFKNIFAFGCAGNEVDYIIKPIYVDKNGCQILDQIDEFLNFSPNNIENFYKEQILGESTSEKADQKHEHIKELHEALRNFGGLEGAEKALIVSAILMAFKNEDFQPEDLRGSKKTKDGNKIYNAIEGYLKDVLVDEEKRKRVLGQFIILKNRIELNEVKSELGKTPLKYFTEFIKNKILPTLKDNTKGDVLGRFYGEFMRFSGGDGQALGIVLTPDHITELFCELIQLKADDKVIDPCCGTAGFLIAAMHHMVKQTKDEKIKNEIKSNRLYGIEKREDMFSIATTNMIFRGDGKSNLKISDFLALEPEELRKDKYTVGFMNPPYSQAKKGASHLSEICFIEQLLDSLNDGGRAVVIVPQSTMVCEKSKKDRRVKERILSKHTLEGVITLNNDTFYRIGVNPCIAVFTAHKKHEFKKYCKFINFKDDGYVVQKHIGLRPTEIAKKRKSDLLDHWLFDTPDKTNKFTIRTTINKSDHWLHSFYYFNKDIPTEEDFDKTISDYLSFEFEMIMKGKVSQNKLYSLCTSDEYRVKTPYPKNWGEYTFDEIFKRSPNKHVNYNKLINVHEGQFTYVTRAGKNNGCIAFVGEQNSQYTKHIYNAITIGTDTSTVFYQPRHFYTGNRVIVLRLKKTNTLNKYNALFLVFCIHNQIKKYTYGYAPNWNRLKKSKILLPKTPEGCPDYNYMEIYIRQLEDIKIKLYLKHKDIGID